MAQDQQTVNCPKGQWTQLTNADATSITFQAIEGDIYVRYTADATTPTEDAGVYYGQGEGELTKSLTDLTALASPVRVWAKPAGSQDASVYVDHA